jgi:hypothetical protein
MGRRPNPKWGEIFRTHPERPLLQPSVLYSRYQVCLLVQKQTGLELTTYCYLALRLQKEFRTILLGAKNTFLIEHLLCI